MHEVHRVRAYGLSRDSKRPPPPPTPPPGEGEPISLDAQTRASKSIQKMYAKN